VLGSEVVDERQQNDVHPEHHAAEEDESEAERGEAPPTGLGQLETGEVEQQRQREQAADLGRAPELDPIAGEEDEQPRTQHDGAEVDQDADAPAELSLVGDGPLRSGRPGHRGQECVVLLGGQ
jgi:hypothetical protein